jgi:hypothetical protein
VATDRELAKEAYTSNPNITYGQIAKRFKVHERTIKRWATADNWQGERKVVALVNAPAPQVRSVSGEIIPIDIVEATIQDLQGEMAAGIQARDKAAIAGKLRDLLIYREQLLPPTLSDLVEQLVADLVRLDVDIVEFVAELKAKWK